MKLFNIILGLIIICIVCSCEDVLIPIDDLEPKYKLVEETAFTDADKVESALNGVYAAWRVTGGGYLPGNIMALSGNMSYGYGNDYNTNTVTPEDSENSSAYMEFYQHIQRASFLIDNLKGDKEIHLLEADRRKEIEAEARLSRAMCHLSLLELYGQFYDLNSEYGVVVRMEASRVIENPERKSVKEVYDAILEDLDFAIEHAPEVSRHYKLSKTVARAYKAKVLLYMKDYSAAAALALEVMSDANYALNSSYEDIFTGHNAQEVLFAPYSAAWTEYMTTVINYSYSPDNIEDIADAEVEDIIIDGTPVQRYDSRYTYAFIDGMASGAPNQKYKLRPASEGELADTYIKMRMSEVYLIYAEAIARDSDAANDNLAIARVNELRDRAGMPHKSPSTSAELLEVIRIEKNLELFAEGAQPWFDMVRYHKYGDINISDIKPLIKSDDQLILPIPRGALLGNTSLVQNPGY